VNLLIIKLEQACLPHIYLLFIPGMSPTADSATLGHVEEEAQDREECKGHVRPSRVRDLPLRSVFLVVLFLGLSPSWATLWCGHSI
jgi:hypothetical protein